VVQCLLPFLKLLQRVREWRSSFGSAALAVLVDFFAKAKFHTQASREDTARTLLKDGTFLYRGKKTENGVVRRFIE